MLCTPAPPPTPPPALDIDAPDFEHAIGVLHEQWMGLDLPDSSWLSLEIKPTIWPRVQGMGASLLRIVKVIHATAVTTALEGEECGGVAVVCRAGCDAKPTRVATTTKCRGDMEEVLNARDQHESVSTRPSQHVLDRGEATPIPKDADLACQVPETLTVNHRRTSTRSLAGERYGLLDHLDPALVDRREIEIPKSILSTSTAAEAEDVGEVDVEEMMRSPQLRTRGDFAMSEHPSTTRTNDVQRKHDGLEVPDTNQQRVRTGFVPADHSTSPIDPVPSAAPSLEDLDPEALLPSPPVPLHLGQNTVTYDIIHHHIYNVPVVYITTAASSNSLPLNPHALQDLLCPPSYRPAIRAIGPLGALSFTPHPFSHMPVAWVHPCRTAEAMGSVLAGREGWGGLEYLLAWFGVVGASVGLDVPVSLAQAAVRAAGRRLGGDGGLGVVDGIRKG